MYKFLKTLVVLFLAVVFTASIVGAQPATSLYELEAISLDKEEVSLSSYKGKVALVVNTASRCGFTSQYQGLEAIYKEYKDRGFVVLGFPSNDYLSQEPGTDEEIKKFCKLNYDVSFPMFSKAPVSGAEKQPVYKFLTEQSNEEFRGDPGWNFVKFLISKEGQVIGRFASRVKPESEEMRQAIETALR
jgi:glutathione peroxidase